MLKTYLQEKIGNPDLFTGRQKELALFLKWIQGIKQEISMSTAILSRRKTGKTALLQRLYNLTFDANDGVIPFYYEVKEESMWMLEFSLDFFLTFLYQYVAFKTRKAEYINYRAPLSTAREIVRKEGCAHLLEWIDWVESFARDQNLSMLWDAVREAPRTIAHQHNEYIVQFIDEFQYVSSHIYRDQAATALAKNFGGGYMITAEYRNAPLLISGSWIGWLRELLHTMLPSRFKQYELENMPEDETVEMIYKYAQIGKIPIAEEVAYAMAQICEGSPFYVSALFQSYFPGKDFTTPEGLLNTLEYETLHERGTIRSVWMEYIGKIFYTVNEEHAKRMVLYLCQHRDREVGRDELRTQLGLTMPELELEQKLHALVKADIIQQGTTNFDFRGVRDNIFDKVFRGVYQKDIQIFDPAEISNEYQTLYKQVKADYRSLLGRFNQTKGLLTEFVIINQLRLHAHQNQEFFRSLTHNLPDDFQFVEYEHVWSYKTARPDKQDIWIDILARAAADQYSLIGEVKNRDTKAFSRAEAEEFVRKAHTLQEREHLTKAVLFVFSRHGFTNDALAYFQEQGIAYSDDERWLGEETVN